MSSRKERNTLAVAGYANTMQEQHTQKNVSIEKRNGANHALIHSDNNVIKGHMIKTSLSKTKPR